MVELDGLPSILGSLADSWTLDNTTSVCLCCSSLHILVVYVSLDLILAKSKRKIKLKGIVVLSRVRLLKARLIGVGCGARTSLCRTSGILRPMIIRGTISGRCRCGREKASFSSIFIRSLIHFCFNIAWFSNRISQLHHEVIVEVVFVWRLRLLRYPRSNDFTFDSLSSCCCSRLRYLR